MTFLLANNWWSLVLRGTVAILLGIIAFTWPGITLGALVLLFGAYAFLDGIFAIVGAVRASRAHERWVALLLEGLAGIVAAAITVFWPAVTALALVYLMGAWALATGVLEIVTAVRLRKYVSGEWLLALGGIVSIVFGVYVIAVPLVGALALAFCVGIYSLIFGVLLVVLGFKLRGWTKTLGTGSSMPLPAR